MRKRDTRYEIRHKARKFAVVFFVLLITYLVSPITISAQESSPSGSLLQKLNELKSDIASKAAKIKSEVNKKVQDKAIMGSILNISDNEMTIQALTSEKTIKYDEFTEIIGLKGKKITLKTLEEKDNIAALGDMD